MLEAALARTPPDAIAASFAALDFSENPIVAVAVSGGSDSVATLLAFDAWLKATGRSATLLALTVDHGLRPESSEEAHWVAQICHEESIAHRTLLWKGSRPKTSLQRVAREARYQLLTNAALDAGARMVLTGHTLDDALETAAMRAGRGSGEGRGLAAIAPATLYENRMWFVRPMLGQRRAALQDWLKMERVSWITDPSNVDCRFERVRMRAQIATGRLSVAADDIEEAQRQRTIEAENAALAVADRSLLIGIDPDANMAVITPGLASAPAGALALGALLSAIGVKQHLPSQGALEKAACFVSSEPHGAAFTVHGCSLVARDGEVLIKREPRNCGAGVFGFDRLLPSFDLALAQALRQRRHLPPLPALPVLAGAR